MSVFIYSDEELAGIWKHIGGTEEVGYALHCLAIANRAAHMLTYAPRHKDACTIEVPRFGEASPADAPSGWTATTWIENLHYNCISNGGTDFAPPHHLVKLLAAAACADATQKAAG
jgi:hypothetical protein